MFVEPLAGRPAVCLSGPMAVPATTTRSLHPTSSAQLNGKQNKSILRWTDAKHGPEILLFFIYWFDVFYFSTEIVNAFCYFWDHQWRALGWLSRAPRPTNQTLISIYGPAGRPAGPTAPARERADTMTAGIAQCARAVQNHKSAAFCSTAISSSSAFHCLAAASTCYRFVFIA